jgi:hypothetical protein
MENVSLTTEAVNASAIMDSADSIPETAWAALESLANVPLWVWAAGTLAGAFGILVLVFPFSAVSY